MSNRSKTVALFERLAVRRTRVAPLVSELETWLRAEYGRLSRHSDVAKAIGIEFPTGILVRADTVLE